MLRRSPIKRKPPAPSVAELDRLARTYVMLRANAALFTDQGRDQWWGACERCGKTGWLSWCHVHTRACHATRWDPDNAFAWCSGCHRWLDQHWEDKRAWVIGRIGQEAFDRLTLRAKGSRPDKAAWKALLEKGPNGTS